MASSASGVSPAPMYWWQNQNSNPAPGQYVLAPIDVDAPGLPAPTPPPAPKTRSARVFSGNRAPTTGGVQPVAEITPVEQAQVFDPSKGLSMPTGGEAVKTATTASVLKEGQASYSTAMKGLAAAGFMTDILNAQAAYRATNYQAQLNIMQAQNQAADALSRGRQAQLDRQSEGYQAGQDASLAMAAQGQNVNGAGVDKIRGSYEAMGIQNGMREEINSIREALGYELEEIAYEYQMDQAEINRNMSFVNSGLNFATAMAVY